MALVMLADGSGFDTNASERWTVEIFQDAYREVQELFHTRAGQWYASVVRVPRPPIPNHIPRKQWFEYTVHQAETWFRYHALPLPECLGPTQTSRTNTLTSE